MTPEQIDAFREDQVNSLLEKGRLMLTVDVNSKEDVEQLLAWMYAPDDQKPMTASLEEMSWDKVAATKKEADLIGHMRSVMQDS